MLYAKDGKPTYFYNLAGLKQFTITSTQALSPGKHQVRMEFTYDGGGLAKGGNVSLFIDGKAVGEGRVAATLAMVYSADETSDVGLKRGSPMTPDIAATGNNFTGTVDVVVIETTGESVDHLLSEEDVLHMIMARQ